MVRGPGAIFPLIWLLILANSYAWAHARGWISEFFVTLAPTRPTYECVINPWKRKPSTIHTFLHSSPSHLLEIHRIEENRVQLQFTWKKSNKNESVSIESASGLSFRIGFTWSACWGSLCNSVTCNHLLILYFMLDKRLIWAERTEIRPADGKTRGRALGYLEKQIEGRDSSMCADCEDRVQENRPGLSLPFLNIITRGYAAALRVRPIKLRKRVPSRGLAQRLLFLWQQRRSWTHVTLHQRALELSDRQLFSFLTLFFLSFFSS